MCVLRGIELCNRISSFKLSGVATASLFQALGWQGFPTNSSNILQIEQHHHQCYRSFLPRQAQWQHQEAKRGTYHNNYNNGSRSNNQMHASSTNNIVARVDRGMVKLAEGT